MWFIRGYAQYIYINILLDFSGVFTFNNNLKFTFNDHPLTATVELTSIISYRTVYIIVNNHTNWKRPISPSPPASTDHYSVLTESYEHHKPHSSIPLAIAKRDF